MPLSLKDTIQGTITNAQNAATADTAGKLSVNAGSTTQPVYFSGGKPVATNYTLAKSVPADAKFTDTDTWRGIQNNLTSDNTTDSLSAAQGKVLKGLVDGKAASGHTHDDRYYTESEIDSKLDGKANANHSHSAFGKATADAAGSAGYVPAPEKGQQEQYLRGDGTWATPTNTTYGLATTSSNGLMSYSDKSKLNGLSNITVDTELSASSTNPVQNKAVYAKNLWLYRAYFYVDSWYANGDQYYQGAYVYAQDGGPTLPTGATLSTPMTTQSDNLSTNETLQATLNIINAGYTTVSSSGYVTVYVSKKPTSDIYVYWHAR